MLLFIEVKSLKNKMKNRGLRHLLLPIPSETTMLGSEKLIFRKTKLSPKGGVVARPIDESTTRYYDEEERDDSICLLLGRVYIVIASLFLSS